MLCGRVDGIVGGWSCVFERIQCYGRTPPIILPIYIHIYTRQVYPKHTRTPIFNCPLSLQSCVI